MAVITIGGALGTVKDEGSTLIEDGQTIDFVGAGVTATQSGKVTTVTIPGGGAPSGSAGGTDISGTYPSSIIVDKARGLRESGGTTLTMGAVSDTQFLQRSGTSVVGAAVTQGHTIEDEGTPLTQRSSLNFTGAGVSVADSGGKTVVNVSATATTNGHVIEDEGTPLTQRSNLNFVGAGVSVADAGGKTVVTIAGAGSSTPTPKFDTDSGNISDLASLFAYIPLSEVNGGVYDRLGRVHCSMQGTVARLFGSSGPSTQEMVVCDFTSSSNYFENTDTSDWFSSSTPFSVMAWFRADTLPAANNDRMTVVSRIRSDGLQGGWALGIKNEFGTTYPAFWTSDGSGAQSLAGVTSIATGTWYCGVWSWDGTTKNFYLNGADQFGASGSAPQAANSTTRFQIGRENHSTPSAFDGRIALVCVWRNRALSSSEASALYNSGTPNRLRGV